MADSDDDYENAMMNHTTKRNGSQNGRNKFKKEREEYSNVDSMKNSYHDKSHYNNNKRSDRSFTPPLSRNERMPSPSRRNNGYQQHQYGQYNNNRHDYSGPYENNGYNYKRSRYDGPPPPSDMDYYSNNFPIDNQYFDPKKSRRDWSVLENPGPNKYYEHDNRSAGLIGSSATDLDDLSEELLPQEYNRLNRPNNYSSYNNSNKYYDQSPFDQHGGPSSNGYYGNGAPFNNPYSMMMMMNNNNNNANGNYRNQFPTFNQNNNNNNQYMHQQMLSMQHQHQSFSNERNFFNNNEFDGQTQPQMLSFKQFMSGLQAESNNMQISQETGIKRYNDYKNSFRREQINLFFAVHKNEDWFKCRYHPDDSAKRKDEQREAIKRRLSIFTSLFEKYSQHFDLSLDMTDDKDRQNLYKFLDACIIKLEGGTDSDLDILEKIYIPSGLISKNENEKNHEENDENKKNKVSDDESGMGSNDNSDEEEEDDDDDDDKDNKNQDSKFDRKKKGKKKKIVKIKEESSIEKNDKTEETITSSKSEETEALAEAATVTEVKKEENPVLKSNTETIVIPQKTQSIFFKHLPVNVTRQDLEEIGKRFPGFKRASISEPAPERRFQRRGWITFDSFIDIKETCSKINGLKLHEMSLNSTINRELDQKVKCIIGLTNDKSIVRNDLKLIAKIVENMDKRWGLWQYVNSYSNNKLNDEDFKLPSDSKKKSKKKTTDEETAVNNDSTNQSIVQNEEEEESTPSQKQELILTKNPFIEEANEYLTKLSNQSNTTPATTTTTNSSSPTTKTEEIKEKDDSDTAKSKLITLNKTFELEKDEIASRLLDKLILYLRIVHSIDYYNVTEYQQEDWMPNRCGILHARGSTHTKSSNQTNIVSILNGMNINYFDPSAIKKVQLEEWQRLFEISIKSYVDYRERIDMEIARRLGLKDLNEEIEKFMNLNCQKVEKDIWLCPISGKKFKGPDYVRKHIETKQRDKLLDLRKDVDYFNRFVLDPKRPYLPEHPLTKNMTLMNSNQQQQQQMAMPYSDYYPRSNVNNNNNNNNMYAQFNQFQPKNFNQYQSNSYPMYNNNNNNNFSTPMSHKQRR